MSTPGGWREMSHNTGAAPTQAVASAANTFTMTITNATGQVNRALVLPAIDQASTAISAPRVPPASATIPFSNKISLADAAAASAKRGQQA